MYDNLQLQVEIEHSEAALKPRVVPSPIEPTKQEREIHNLTHLPYRSWCPICVRAKGKQTPHRKGGSTKPLIQVDFAFVSIPEDPKSQATILTGIDVRTQMCMAVQIPSKGYKSIRYSVLELKRFIYECGRTAALIQCDEEPSIKAIVKTLLREMGGLSMRTAPV